MTKRESKKQDGFTLIELIVTLTLTAIIGLAVAPMIAVSVDAITLHIEHANLEENANVAVSRLTRDIRRLRNDESVVAASSSTFSFFDVDDVAIVYSFSGNTLSRTQSGGAGAQPIAETLAAGTGAVFTYFDDDGNTIGSPTVGLGTVTNIRRIEIALSFDDGGQTYVTKVQIQPRNVRHFSNLFA